MILAKRPRSDGRLVFKELGNRGQQNPQPCCDGLVVYVRSEASDHDKLPDRSLLHIKQVVSLLPPRVASAVGRVGQKAGCAAEAQSVVQ